LEGSTTNTVQMLSRSDRSFLKGVCLGDGCLRQVTTYPGLHISHAQKQFEFLRWKVGKLNRIFDIKQPISSREADCQTGSFPACQWWSNQQELLLPIYRELYSHGKKEFTASFLRGIGLEGLAVLYMDDGNLHLRKRGVSTRTGDPYIRERIVELALYIPYDTALVVSDWIESLTGAFLVPRVPMAKKNPHLWNLRANGTSARQFVEVLKPYGCEAMRYKFDLRYDTRTNRGKSKWSEADRNKFVVEADKVTRARSAQTEGLPAVGDDIVYSSTSLS
jgi:hypothetical protein